MVRILRALALLAPLALGCGDPRPKPHSAIGIVRDLDPAQRIVVIEHGDIEGLMPAMTMSFDVAEPRQLAGISAGAHVSFDVVFDGSHYRVTRIEAAGGAIEPDEAGVSGSDDGADARPSLAEMADARDPAPEFALIDQSGRGVSLASLHGRVLLLDFVYTSCRGPCPILTGLHADVQRALTSATRAGTQFVSISLDPETDTPAVLMAWATARGADLADWSFLTGPKEEVADVVRRYGVGTLRRVDGQIDHVVATFLIDREGRIAKRYLGLEHEAADLARDVTELAAAAPAAGVEAAALRSWESAPPDANPGASPSAAAR